MLKLVLKYIHKKDKQARIIYHTQVCPSSENEVQSTLSRVLFLDYRL